MSSRIFSKSPVSSGFMFKSTSRTPSSRRPGMSTCRSASQSGGLRTLLFLASSHPLNNYSHMNGAFARFLRNLGGFVKLVAMLRFAVRRSLSQASLSNESSGKRCREPSAQQLQSAGTSESVLDQPKHQSQSSVFAMNVTGNITRLTRLSCSVKLRRVVIVIRSHYEVPIQARRLERRGQTWPYPIVASARGGCATSPRWREFRIKPSRAC